MSIKKCSKCRQFFRKDKIARDLPFCQHKICQSCLIQAILCKNSDLICCHCSSITPKDRIEMFPINQKISYDQMVGNNTETEQIRQNKEKLQMQQNDDLLIQSQNELDKMVEISDLQSVELKAGEDICIIHNTIKDIICITDKEMICPHCALFGNHKDHSFTNLNQFFSAINSKADILSNILKQKKVFTQQDHPQQILKNNLSKRKQELIQLLQKSIGQSIKYLKQKQQNIKDSIKSKFIIVENYCKLNVNYKNYDRLIKQFENWEINCIQSLNKIKGALLSDKIKYFYDNSLQNVTQGQIYLKQLKQMQNQINKCIVNKLQGISLVIDKNLFQNIENSIKLKTNIEKEDQKIKGKKGKQEIRIDELLDFTSSQIGNNSRQSSTFINNTSISEFQNITSSKSINHEDLKKNTVTSVKSLKSLNKIQPKVDHHRKTVQSNGGNQKIIQQITKQKHHLKQQQQSPKIRIMSPKPKISIKKQKQTLLQEFLLQTQTKQYDTKRAQSILLQFTKNKFADFLDLSELNLPNERILQYVQKAKTIHKLKSLKLSSNKMNIVGFQRLLSLIKGINNINLSNNMINQSIFDVLIKNKDKLDILKVINLAHNPIKFQKRMSTKIEQLKKIGIMVIL